MLDNLFGAQPTGGDEQQKSQQRVHSPLQCHRIKRYWSRAGLDTCDCAGAGLCCGHSRAMWLGFLSAARCVSCHRSGEVAPFPLVSYADAAKRAGLIAQVTASGFMPPWKPEAGYGDFEGARGLTPGEIDTLRRWAVGGAQQGNATELRPLPASGGNRLESPDLTARMAKSYAVPAEGPDLYRCFVIPLGLSADRYVDAIEFRPGN